MLSAPTQWEASSAAARRDTLEMELYALVKHMILAKFLTVYYLYVLFCSNQKMIVKYKDLVFKDLTTAHASMRHQVDCLMICVAVYLVTK